MSKWIPVTEKLPQVDSEYGSSEAVLVTIQYGEDKYKFVYIANWCEKDYMRFWRIEDEYAEDIVAWMPLPKPWEGKENDDV